MAASAVHSGILETERGVGAVRLHYHALDFAALAAYHAGDTAGDRRHDFYIFVVLVSQ